MSPSLETLTKIAEALDVSLDVIVYGYSRNNVKPEDASLSEKIEKLNTLPAEEKYIANELLNLVFARQSLKNIIGNFNDVPEELIKKQNKNTRRVGTGVSALPPHRTVREILISYGSYCTIKST